MALRYFKARIECSVEGERTTGKMLAMEIWLNAPNIMAAAQMVHDLAITLGYDDDNIVKLVEYDSPKPEPEKTRCDMYAHRSMAPHRAHKPGERSIIYE